MTLKKCLSILAAFLLFSGIVGCRMTSDSRLEKTFRDNRNDFDKLLTMAQQDTSVRVITPRFTSGDADANGPGGSSFTQQRWNEYRKLFQKLGVSGGLVHSDGLKGATFFLVDSQGIFVTNGLYKGYVYFEKPLSPLVNSLDAMPENLYDKSGHAIAFKALGGNWYLYREEY